MDGHEGLESLLDEAYLAHRLVEEVNDLYIKHFGQPLIPSNTTVASVIAHQLIGEQFANQLDEAVHHAVDELLDEESFALDSVEAYREKLTNPETGRPGSAGQACHGNWASAWSWSAPRSDSEARITVFAGNGRSRISLRCYAKTHPAPMFPGL